MPLTQVPEGDQFDLSPWREVLAHPAEGDFWKDLDASPLLADVGVPTLHLSGWYDLMLNQTLLSYEGMVAGRGRAKGRQKLVIGPWHHQSLFSWTPGRPGGGKGGQKVPDVLPLIGAWLEKWLGNRQRSREAAKKLQQVPDVSLYVMAADQWLGSDRFPCPKSHTMDWYLTAGGDADCEDRGGGLVKQPPEQAGRDTFRYDPEDPVPTLGGSIWPLPAAKLNPGRQDQSPAEQRSDVVLYSSPPLEEDLLVVGRLTVELWATSSAGETDFTAKLVDVDSEGVPRIVQDGIVRCRFQRSRSSEPPPAPEEPHCFHLDLQATGHCFHRGHRLRLEISSSNFPKFDRNLNTTEPLHTASAGTTAQQTTFHGGRFTSRIRLPVIRSKYLKKNQRDPFKAVSGAVAGGGLGKIRAYYHFGKNRWKGKLLELLSSQFGKPAGVLGGLVGRVLAHYNREINLWTIALLEIESDDHVLEIGFGPGMAVQKAAEIAAEGYVAGIDYSEVMVRQARKRNATAIGEGRVELIHGSAMELPYNADSFDKIYAVNSVQVWPDRLVVMKQLRRILKPGGLVALTLQPRWVKGEKAVREIGREIVADLDAAEFSQTRMEFIQTKMEVQGIEPVPCICALGVKQAHPANRDEPPAGDRG
ncbi:MAG: CocE/NonD family hydrolase [bacterium]|nr:CocE/NonD family hydrolase [bacterium]